MEAIGYGILIAFLMGLSAFAGAYLVLKFKVKGTNDIRLVRWGSDEKDDEIEAQLKREVPKVFNIEDLPTAEMAYSRTSYSEELNRGKRPA